MSKDHCVKMQSSWDMLSNLYYANAFDGGSLHHDVAVRGMLCTCFRLHHDVAVRRILCTCTCCSQIVAAVRVEATRLVKGNRQLL
jgi:hypothetical protein